MFSLDGAVARFALAAKTAEKKEFRIPERILNRAWSLVNWTLIQAIWERGIEVPHLRGPMQEWNDRHAKDRKDVLHLCQEGLRILSDKVEVQ
jgi:hypothetical protein